MEPAQLPYSPLTHRELNDRAAAAISRCGFYAAACVRVGGVTARDTEVLREYTDEFDRWQDAATIRASARLERVAS